MTKTEAATAYDELHVRLDTNEGEKDLHWLAKQGEPRKDVQQIKVIKDKGRNILMTYRTVSEN